MEKTNYGNEVKAARTRVGLTQAELAEKCHLGIRTIQRIESGDVSPRIYTVKLINEALGIKISNYSALDTETSTDRYKIMYQKRKQTRIILFITMIIILVFAGLIIVISPTDSIFGLRKREWGPVVYALVFIHLIALGIYWRCPSCNSLLGEVFSTKFCNKCGLKLED